MLEMAKVLGSRPPGIGRKTRIIPPEDLKILRE